MYSPFAKHSQDAPNCAWTSAPPSPSTSHKKEPLWREGNGAIGKRRSDPELLSAMKRQRHPSQATHPSTRLKMKMISCLRPFTSLSRLKTMSSRKFAAWFNNYARISWIIAFLHQTRPFHELNCNPKWNFQRKTRGNQGTGTLLKVGTPNAFVHAAF